MKNLSIKTGFDRKTLQKFLLLSACSFGVYMGSAQSSFAQVRQDFYINQLPFITGGFGNEEQNAIKQHAAQFNLHLTFAQSADRAYIAGVETLILDAQGKEIFKDTHTGPLLYLKLTAGTYTAKFNYKGETKIKSITIASDKTQALTVTW